MRKLALLLGLLCAGLAQAVTPQDILRELEAEARRGNSGFAGFSAGRGERFYHAERTGADGVKLSCATCHTADPRAIGKTRANKDIAPMAPAANRERFTDAAKVDKWFRRNCNDVLGRACTAEEKGDFLTYLVNIR